MGRKLTSPLLVRFAVRAYVLVAVVGVIAAGGAAAFALGLSASLETQLADPRAAPSERAQLLRDIALATGSAARLDASIASLEKLGSRLADAEAAAQRYAGLAETPAEKSGAADLAAGTAAMRALAQEALAARRADQDASTPGVSPETAAQLAALQAALAPIIDAQSHVQLERRYAVLEAWTRWSGRAGAGALIALAVFAGLGGLLARAASQRAARRRESDAARFDEAVAAIAETGLRFARAVEALEHDNGAVQTAGRDLARTSQTLAEIGRTFGDGAAALIGRLEKQAGALGAAAERTATQADAAFRKTAASQARLAQEVAQLGDSNQALAALVDQARPGLLAAIEALSTSAHAFDHASEAAAARFEEAVITLNRGGDVSAEAARRLQDQFADGARAVSEAVERLHAAADAVTRADERAGAELDAAIARGANDLRAAREALQSALQALVGEKGLLPASARRLAVIEDRLAARSAAHSDRLDDLTEKTGAGLIAVLRRLDEAAGEIQDAADRFWRDETSAAPLLHALRAAMEAAEPGAAARPGPRLASA